MRNSLGFSTSTFRVPYNGYVPAGSNKKRALLWVAFLVVMFLVGFGLGVALWEGIPALPQDTSPQPP